MKTNESGRTLLEMIGVITLMGVFTMGSVSLYRDAVAKMRVNDLLEHVRKRALVSSKHSSKITYGMYDKQGGGASPITAYGFGVGDNKTGVERDKIGKYGISIIPVGAVNGGQPLDRRTCEALLRKIHKAEDGPPMVGSVVEVYRDKGCRYVLTSCGSDDKEKPTAVPDIICIGIKS